VPERDDIEAAEAYAFLKVVAPKLEQLRRRLVLAKGLLGGDDPEQARLGAIVESQLALKEFLAALPDFNALVEPIDVLLDAVREEAADVAEAPTADAVEPAPEAPAPPPPAAKLPDPPARPDLTARAGVPDDAWLRVGTAVALEKLTNAGMAAGGAEFYLEQLYATIGLRTPDGASITVATIKDWRTDVVGPGAGAWRRGGLMKRRGPGKGPASLQDAKARVDEIAVMFKKMAPWMSGATQGRTR